MRKPCFRNRLDITVFFNEDAVRAIHHDFADIGIENEVLDRARNGRISSKPFITTLLGRVVENTIC